MDVLLVLYLVIALIGAYWLWLGAIEERNDGPLAAYITIVCSLLWPLTVAMFAWEVQMARRSGDGSCGRECK
jgi:hypothetical protein